MTTIKIQFNYEGKSIMLSARLKDDMTLCDCKGNESVEIFYDVTEDANVEVVMYRGPETDEMVTEAEYGIVWGKGDDGVIKGEFDVKCNVISVGRALKNAKKGIEVIEL